MEGGKKAGVGSLRRPGTPGSAPGSQSSLNFVFPWDRDDFTSPSTMTGKSLVNRTVFRCVVAGLYKQLLSPHERDQHSDQSHQA